MAEASELPPERLAEPIEALEAGATPELVRLGLWVAREYCSTPSRGLQLVLPPGPGPAAAAARCAPRPSCGRSSLPAGEAALEGGERLGAKQRAALEALRAGEMSAGRAGDRGRLRPRRRCAGSSSAASSPPAARPSAASPASRASAAAAAPARSCCPSRRRRSSAIVAALDGEAGAARQLLLHGVTGSGKTEVYLAAVEAALERGKGAIVLVPEIGLAPQAVARFRARLGDRFAVLHSALSAGERYDEWRRLRSGEASVCVGPRSAVFAPVRDLGLIVIDEEHDASYKQEGDPTYDARAVARKRAERQRRRPRRRHRDAAAGELAGAAAPGAAAAGRRPPDAAGRTWSTCARPTRARARVHAETWEALEGVRAAGAKAIVMINRRGFAPWLTCRSCGHHWDCPNCDVSLIVHRHSGRLVCHHCAHAEPQPRACPECGSMTLSRGRRRHRADRGAAGRAAGPMPVLRLDSDTAAERGAHARILAALRRGRRAPSSSAPRWSPRATTSPR